MDRGKILSGNWDKQRTLFINLPVYQAFTEHFIYHKKWDTTFFYTQISEEIRKGEMPWGCRSVKDFNERLNYINWLYKDIQKNGYKTQCELLSDRGEPVSFRIIDEITVRIGRNGEILFEDGRHRLSIAKLVNTDKIPVKITVRHRQWFQFRKEILAYAAQHGGRVYHPLPHMDLSDIPSVHGEKRYNIIKPHIARMKGKLLDIGAHWGYFCHKFEEMNFQCCAVEHDVTNLYFLYRLKKAQSRNFKVIANSIFNCECNTHFDVVLALNIFHHFLKIKELYNQLTDFLRHLSADYLFFQPHLPDDPQMINAYKNYNCEAFVNYILKYSAMDKAKLIGTAEDGRPVYLIYKKYD
ncbi:MAG: hypothetical protein V2I97_24070 [Desulfococcaceae bacterium]|nr:hypothetical protein [Desulfococcaceae bacterium]